MGRDSQASPGLSTCHDPAAWDAFVSSASDGSLLQSWGWGDLKSRYGWQPTRYFWKRGETAVGAVSVLRRRMPAGFSMHYAPRGPVLNGQFEEWPGLWRALRRRLFQEGGVVLRVDPEWTADGGVEVLRSVGADAANPVQHQATALIDLRGGEEVFSRMSASARRNIRKAERAGVRIVKSRSREALDQLYRMLADTSLRKAFPIRPRSYYSDILEIFGGCGMATVYLACHDGQPVAGSLMLTYGGKLIYLFSGSTDRGLDLKAAYLLQQEAIRDAQARGLTTYDLWGIPLQTNKAHPGWGYSHFKEMLGGQPVRFIGSFDIPVTKPMALAFHLAERATNYNASFV